MPTERKEEKPAEGDGDPGTDAEGEKKTDEKAKGLFGMPKMHMPKMHMPSPADIMKRAPEPEPPNLLWQHIEAKQWEEVAKDVEGDDLSELVTTSHKENLPLHVVCKSSKVPDEIVLKILAANPEAVKERGKSRMYPLQIAVSNKRSYNVIRSLILAYPDALDARIDDQNPIRLETTRTWVDLQGHPTDVKKLLQRSSADWKVIAQYEEEQKEQHDKLITLEKRLKTAKKKNDNANKLTMSLKERVEELEAAHHRISISIGDEIQEKENAMKERLSEIREKFQEFVEMQEAKNKEMMNDLATAKSRKDISNAVLEMKKEELVGLFKESLKEAEKLRKNLSSLTPEA